MEINLWNGERQVVIHQEENKVLVPEHAVLEAGLTRGQTDV